MSWTKLQIVDEAYAELALAGYTFDMQPQEMERAGRRLDLMMASWDAMGIQIGYQQALSPGALDLSADSGIPLNALDAVVTNLALLLAPGEGKTPHEATRARAKQGIDTLMAAAAVPRRQQLREGLPLGAGNKRRGPFVATPDTSALQVGEDGNLQFLE